MKALLLALAAFLIPLSAFAQGFPGGAAYYNSQQSQPSINGATDALVGNLTTTGIRYYNGAVNVVQGDTGTLFWSMPEQGSAYKKVILVFDKFKSEKDIVIPFPVEFRFTPGVNGVIVEADKATMTLKPLMETPPATTTTDTATGMVTSDLAFRSPELTEYSGVVVVEGM